MNKTREPLIHIVKRSSLKWYQTWGIRLLAIVIALVVCGLITTITTGLSPIAVYASMLNGAFGSTRKIWVTLQNTAILLIISLAVTPAFRMRFWNIGAEGQTLIGALAAAACMIKLGGVLPQAVLVIVMILASVAAGAVWAAIPAFFKAKWNTNETLFTLMMNYVATQLVAYFIILWEVPKGSGTIGIINSSTEAGWMSLGNRYLLPIIVAVLFTVFTYIYLNYTKHGYEIAVVGESEATARYVGINVRKVIIRTCFLSGAMCGVVGLLLAAGINHTLTTTLVDGRGFTAVMVSWMAQFNPVTMVLTSLLIVFFSRGAGDISTTFGLNESFADILVGIVIFFLIGCEFFIRYRVCFRKAAGKTGKEEKTNA